MIYWTRAWNPVLGCTPCSRACDNCYAERLHNVRHRARLAGKSMPECYGRPFEEVRLLYYRLSRPLGWRKPQRVFVGDMGDLFHPDVRDAWLDLIFAVMALSPQHTFMLLTKRAERMAEYIAKGPNKLSSWSAVTGSVEVTPTWPLPNVWLGTTIWDQASADRAVPILLSTPAAKRWVSVEPMLGPVNLAAYMTTSAIHQDEIGLADRKGEPVYFGKMLFDYSPWMDGLDWVICGGETGAHARPMHPAWPRALRDQCQAAGVPFWFKQWGEWEPRDHGRKLLDHVPQIRLTDTGENGGILGASGKNDCWMQRSGTRRAGRVLDGRTWEEVPNAHP